MIEKKSSSRRRWYIGGGFIFIVVALFASLPWIGKQLIIHQLQAMSAKQASIAGLSVNVFASTLSLQDIQVQTDEQRSIALESLSLHWDFRWQEKQLHIYDVQLSGLQVNAVYYKDGSLSVGLDNDQHQSQAGNAAIASESELSGSSEPEKQTPAIDKASANDIWRVSLDQLRLDDIQLNLYIESLAYALALKTALAANDVQTSTVGELSLASLAVQSFSLSAAEQQLLAFEQFAIADIKLKLLPSMQEANQEAGQETGQKAGAESGQPPAQQPTIQLGAVQLNTLTVDVLRNKQGAIEYVAAIAEAFASTAAKTNAAPAPPVAESSEAGSESEAAMPAVPAEQAAAVAWSVASFAMSGENQIRLRDASVEPPADITLAIQNIALSALNSDKPAMPTDLNIAASLDEFSQISLVGDIKPLLSAPELNITTDIKQLDISPFAAYMADITGYQIASGQLNLQSELALQGNILDVQNKLNIQKFTVAMIDKEKAKAFEGDIVMPLDKALDLLRDKKDNVALSIPISGSIDSPDFAIASVISKATRKALSAATMTYLKFALQPWGALITIAQKVGEKARRIKFQPIAFEPGKDIIQAADQPYVKKLAKLLDKKKKLRISLCGLSAPADNQALLAAQQAATAERLEALSRQRSTLLKEHLINEYDIDAERLFICAPRHETDAQAMPRVDITL